MLQLDTAVLQFQNQKLCQKLEVQKIEIVALENKLSQRKEKQQSYDKVLTAVSNCWKKVKLGHAFIVFFYLFIYIFLVYAEGLCLLGVLLCSWFIRL